VLPVGSSEFQLDVVHSWRLSRASADTTSAVMAATV